MRSAGGLTTLAQQSHTGQQPETLQDPFAPGQGYQHKLPASARIGSTPERKAAWDKLTPAEKDVARRQLNEIITKVKQKAGPPPAQDDEDAPVTLAFTDKDGKRLLRGAAQSKQAPHNLKFITQTARLDAKKTRGTTARKSAMFAHAQLLPLKRNFAALAMQTSCYKSVEQFIRDFYQNALGRQPNAGEFATWNDALALAQTQGSWQLIAQAQDLGRALFQAQEYINRGRADRDYVYDLYKGYLQREPDQGGWDAWTNLVPSIGRDNVREGFAGAQEFYNHVTALCAAATYDPDGDGLPNDFENRVADAFTPYYHVSASESDQFATFNNTVPAHVTDLSIKQLYGQNVVSHFRVTPHGFSYNASGQLISVLRLDYLTIWNNDSGILSGALCAWDLFGLGELINELSGHRIDNEHSELLVAAPVSDYSYNLDPGAYSTYYVYTAAHEFERIGDHSGYLDLFYSPVPAYYHVELGMSLSKHATYTFNPDYLPLTPWYIIFDAYNTLDYLYYTDQISAYTYLISLAIADDVFFSCLVERFFDQGGRYAFLRTNVGEPYTPLNESDFIRVPELNRQLTTPFFR